VRQRPAAEVGEGGPGEGEPAEHGDRDGRLAERFEQQEEDDTLEREGERVDEG
jgi:hypothetical protein